MGQYWKVANLDKKEFIDPHKLGVGLKLGEQIGSGHGTPDALFILVAAMRERRGGGDFDWDSNYYGEDRYTSGAKDPNIYGGKVNEDYNECAKRTIGRWAGDRIVVVGDYSEDADLPKYKNFGNLYSVLSAAAYPDDRQDLGDIDEEYRAKYKAAIKEAKNWTDVTDDVARVIEHEVGGKFVGDGWKDFKKNKQAYA